MTTISEKEKKLLRSRNRNLTITFAPSHALHSDAAKSAAPVSLPVIRAPDDEMSPWSLQQRDSSSANL